MTTDKNYTVYMHVNKKNGKVYIGQTRFRPEQRWGKNGNGYKKQTYFWNAICKYSWDNFEHCILKELLSSEEADELERELILKYDSTNPEKGYNLESGGNVNKHHSERTKQKLSNMMKGKYCGENSHVAKMVAQYDLGGNLICIWDYARKAAKELNIQESGISECCNGNYERVDKFIFRYVDNKNNVPTKISGITRIAQYDLNGNLIKVWDYLQQVADALKIKGSNIAKCCNGEQKRVADFMFRYVRSDEEIISKIDGARKYGQFDKFDNCIHVFNSLKEIKELLGIDSGGVSKCCMGKAKTAGGYIWKYVY